MEIGKAADYSSRHLISSFTKMGKKKGLIKEVLIDAEDMPAARAWELTPKGLQVLYHLKEIEQLVGDNSNNRRKL